MLLETRFSDLGKAKKGKVRDIYDLGDQLLIVATDRISAFDVVLPSGIPDKGKVLTQLSLFWFKEMEEIVGNHVVEWDVERYPDHLRRHKEELRGRSMLARKARVFPVECVVRGYLAGSAWAEYREKGTACGIPLRKHLVESQQLEEPLFTPSTKAEEGHDMNISMEGLKDLIGERMAEELKRLTIMIYKKAAQIAQARGILVADAKFEFGTVDGKTIIVDEALTPDSSRFWSAKHYKPGESQDSYDKQIVRDYLNGLTWDKTYPGPALPPEIVDKAAQRYREIFEILTGTKLK